MNSVRSLATAELRIKVLACSLLVLIAQFVLAPAHSEARSKVSLQGKLTKKGLKVLAVACNGAASISRRSGNSFLVNLPTPTSGVSLQLIDSKSRYSGPILLKRKGRKGAIAFGALGKGRYRLGNIKVESGYATVRSKLPGKIKTAKAAVQLTGSGKPKGAGRLGLTEASKKPRSRCTTKGSKASVAKVVSVNGNPGADPDADGIPNVADVDNNGNNIIDNVDPSAYSSSGAHFYFFSDMFVDAADTLNANTQGGSTAYDSAVKSFLKTNLGMPLGWSGEESGADEIVVDCGSIVFCKRSGNTATLRFPTSLEGQNWVVATRSSSSNGNPTIPYTSPSSGGRGWEVTVKPGLDDTIHQLQVGDTLLATTGKGSQSTTTPLVMPAFFLTQPAVVKMKVGAGVEEGITYPVSGAGSGGKNSQRKTVNSLTNQFLWLRPQRPPVTDAEKAAFKDNLSNLDDFFGLRYYATVGVGEISTGPYYCGADAMATTDTNLEVQELSDGNTYLVDKLTEGSNGQTLNATFDFSKCKTGPSASVPNQTVEQALAALPAPDKVFRVDFNASDTFQNNGIQTWYFFYQL